MTRQRKLIFEELRKVKSHPTVDMVYDMVKKKMPRLSLGTVYRNLELLASEGKIQKLGIDNQRKRFDGDISAHNHIICVNCGKVDDIFINADVTLTSIENDIGYEITGHIVEFFGKCPECKSID